MGRRLPGRNLRCSYICGVLFILRHMLIVPVHDDDLHRVDCIY
jgi:hypothetical protein